MKTNRKIWTIVLKYTVLFGNTTNSDNKDLQNCSQIQDGLDQRILSEFYKNFNAIKVNRHATENWSRDVA